MATFVERFKTATFGSLADEFCQHRHKLIGHCISAKFLLMEGYVQGALRKEMHIAPFVERFKTVALGNS